MNPHAAANALSLQPQDIAERVAANIAKRIRHPREDPHQIVMLCILQAARRFSTNRGSFRLYARTCANRVAYHYLRVKGFLIEVPTSWGELHARGAKLMQLGLAAAMVLERLEVSAERWRGKVVACSQRMLALEPMRVDE